MGRLQKHGPWPFFSEDHERYGNCLLLDQIISKPEAGNSLAALPKGGNRGLRQTWGNREFNCSFECLMI